MDDTINRQAAINMKGLLEDWTGKEYEAVLVEDIERLPSAQPKRGKWIRDGHHIRCDQCGIYMCDTDREGDKISNIFCPNCGSYNGGEINDQ